jgi:hypothetical protein
MGWILAHRQEYTRLQQYVKKLDSKKTMDEFGRPIEKEQVVMLVPHHGAGFEETLVFTSLEKAKRFWSILETRDCVEFRQLNFDVDLDAWVY